MLFISISNKNEKIEKAIHSKLLVYCDLLKRHRIDKKFCVNIKPHKCHSHDLSFWIDYVFNKNIQRINDKNFFV